MNNTNVPNEINLKNKYSLQEYSPSDNIDHCILSKNITSIYNNEVINMRINRHASRGLAIKSDINHFNQEKINIDHLFTCRDLFKRYPESMATAQAGKIIRVEWQNSLYYVPSKKITLPGGHDIYVAQFNNRTLLSDGDIYHIEDLVSPPPPSLMAYMLNLVSHLVGIVSSHITLPGVYASTAPPDPASAGMPRSEYRQDRQPASRPFLLPGAAGTGDSDVDQVTDLPFRQNQNAAERVHQRQDMDICETNLHLPLHGARQVYATLRGEYINIAKEKIYSLEWMSGMNTFVQNKLTEIFDQASYLQDRIRCADIIMIKRHIEKNLENCLASRHGLTLSEKRLEKIFFDQTKIEDIFISFRGDMIKALHDINFKTLRSVIEYKNGINYEEAKQNFRQKINETGQSMNATDAEFYSLIVLMENAQKIYDKNLNDDGIPIIKKLLYFNDRELFLTMLDENPHGISQVLVKRFFYYIFEYSRNNGFTTRGNFYIVPGEFTEFWHNFQQPERALNEDDIAKLLSDQVLDYMNNDNKPKQHLERAIICIDFVRTHYAHVIKALPWRKANIWPYNKCLAILDRLIATDLGEANEQKKPIDKQWSDSVVRQIIYNKECTFLIQFIIRLQNTLIAITHHHLQEKITLSASTNEQRLIEAKILAMKMVLPGRQIHLPHKELLSRYNQKIAEGNIDLLLRAAIYWYFENHSRQSYRYADLDALYIIKNFQEAERVAVFDFQRREDKNFQTIFDLRHSDNFTTPKEYYDQFIYYKAYTLNHEARYLSYKMIERSSLDFLELTYPPKEIYTFKIFSRNYVQNSLTPASDVFLPQNNFGTISLVKTYHQKWVLVSSLLSAPAIKEMALSEDDMIIKNIIKESQGTQYQLDWQNRKQISVTADDLLKIFDIAYNQSVTNLSPLNFFLVKPEENIASNARSEYLLVAGISDNPLSSLLEVIDYWNAQTLSEALSEFKESLRITLWWEQLLFLIPFYETIWKYWYDEDNEIEIIEVIFDIFDLAFLFGEFTTSAGRKISSVAKGLAEITDLASLPSKYLNRRVSQALLKELPGLARQSSLSLAQGFLIFCNPVPIPGSLNNQFQKKLIKTMSADISWISNSVLNTLEKRKTQLIYWQYTINDQSFTIESDGTYIIDKGLSTERTLIKIADNFYQVIWDNNISRWRIINQYELVNLNYAVPIDKDKNGSWDALNFFEIDTIPLLNENSGKKEINFEFSAIMFEPLRRLTFAQNNYKKYNWEHSYYLELILDRYTPHLTELFEKESELSTMLADFAACLTDEKKFRTIFSMLIEESLDENLRSFVNDFIKPHNIQVSYRIARMWRDEHDHHPDDHIVILLGIKEQSYIIDISYLRPVQINLFSDRQVFIESEWIHYLKTRIKKDYSLIKYKDFTDIKKALVFPYREADHAGKYIKDAFLVREPLWYKTAIIKYFYHGQEKSSPFDNHRPPTVLAAVRHIIAKQRSQHEIHSSDVMNMTLPFDVLQEAQIINATQADEMINLMSKSLYNGPALLDFMSGKLNITSCESLIKLKAGSLLAFISDGKYLFHLMICVGNGRFAGLGNDFLSPSFKPGPSIVVAEEMGLFMDHQLIVRNSTTPYMLVAGHPATATATESVIDETITVERIAKVSSSGERVIEDITFAQRAKMLTDNAWSLAKSPNDDRVLVLKMEVLGANIHPLYTRELAHTLRALIFANPDFPAFSTITAIEITSCFTGFDGVDYRGQTLADELGIPIRTAPYLDTDDIRQRQPHWYGHFSPRRNANHTTSLSPEQIATMFSKKNKSSRVHAKNQRLANIVDILRDIRKSLNNTRIKRNMAFLPTIFIDLARLIIRDINFYNFIEIYHLSNESEKKLNNVLREYTVMISEADEFFIQCFLDIILAVDDFNHLAKWIFSAPLATTQASLSPAPQARR
ncbi:hypothetical protein ACL2XP_23425 [Sodalis sp. RH21]|uniref:hypothetical protein n=1 Tax=unclassified Sodalis (in: enterobacteria) TaxID=2636512 RepID=UPI0039B37AE5